MYSIPDGFTLHRQLVKILDSKKDMIEGKQPIDWATGDCTYLLLLLANILSFEGGVVCPFVFPFLLILSLLFFVVLAEALAFGTLIKEGNHVRLSGQDVERGTFR